MTTTTTAPPVPRTKKPHIHAIDLIRVCIISLVIATHLAATGPFYGTVGAGYIWMVSHTSRNLFLILTAFVLCYQYYGTPLRMGAFYKKRIPLIAIPYAVWTLIYQLQDGLQQQSVWQFIGVFLQNFISASAMYHLYFLLLSLQIYLLFPFIIKALNRFKQHLGKIIAVSFIAQLAITALYQQGYTLSLFGSPDNFILNYQFYVLLGCTVAVNFEAIKRRIATFRRQIILATIGTMLGGLGFYALQLHLGVAPADAAMVFQPFMTLESLLFFLTLLSVGLYWETHGMHLRRFIQAVGVSSFGIYLAHPFIIKKLEFLQPATTSTFIVILSVLVGIPLIYGVTFVLVEVARRTPLSVLLTGRKQAPLVLKKDTVAPVVAVE